LTHRSFCAEVDGTSSNERLELLGDAVLGLVVADHLYQSQPDVPEGDLARMRALVVSEAGLAPVAAEIGIGAALRIGRGEAHSGGRAKPSILADALEAVIGAVYLHGGIERARSLVLDVMGEQIEIASAVAELGDAKNRLQELAARLQLSAPRYSLREHGPDHERHYDAVVTVCDASGDEVGRGRGGSIEEAGRASCC